VALYWKGSHLLWTGGHLSWGASCCCNFDSGTTCTSPYKVRFPHVLAMTIDDASGAVASKCDEWDIGPPIPASSTCAFGAPGAVPGKTNRCTVMNGTWELHDDAVCDFPWGTQLCIAGFGWTFCSSEGCTNTNGSCQLQAGYQADPVTGEPCYFGRVILTDQCFTPPFVIWTFYDVTYLSDPLAYNSLTGAYNGVGTFDCYRWFSGGYGFPYSSSPGGSPCIYPTHAIINAS
jgi:hypothetical protein